MFFSCHQILVTNFLSPIFCHQFPVTNFLSLISCHLFLVTNFVSPISCHQFPVTNFLSPISCHFLSFPVTQFPVISCCWVRISKHYKIRGLVISCHFLSPHFLSFPVTQFPVISCHFLSFFVPDFLSSSFLTWYFFLSCSLLCCLPSSSVPLQPCLMGGVSGKAAQEEV